MVIFRSGGTRPNTEPAASAHGSRVRARRVALASGAAVLGLLLSACQSDDDAADGGPEELPGTAQPAPDDSDDSDDSADSPDDSADAPSDDVAEEPTDQSEPPAEDTVGGSDGGTTGGTTGGTIGGTTGGANGGQPADDNGTGTICDTSDLSASIGQNQPGAGQMNFPIVLTNSSDETCVVYGYPGLAFLDGEGEQLGYDPEREPGQAATVTLTPGQSAWSALSYGNPDISEALSTVPDAVLLTPPDQTESLTVDWGGEEVPMSGTRPTVSVFRLGTGA
jgi:hypothetical protein